MLELKIKNDDNYILDESNIKGVVRKGLSIVVSLKEPISSIDLKAKKSGKTKFHQIRKIKLNHKDEDNAAAVYEYIRDSFTGCAGGNHSFQARYVNKYDEVINNINIAAVNMADTNDDYFSNSVNKLDSCDFRTYAYDICIKCGKKVYLGD